jgi:cell division protein FtsB
MVRRSLTEPPDPFDAPAQDDDDWSDPVDDASEEASEEAQVVGRVSLEGLSIAGITRRRAAFTIGALVTLWIVAVFARQVGDASAATARADRLRTGNAAIATNVAALQAELQTIQQQPYVEQQARAYGLGTTRERPFTLAPDAPPLAADAPGSAAVRLGAATETRSPLETWLSLLFGPSPAS